jgi:endonuclease/exonuclease/phosphatase family metal-dependent hydrolase
MYHRIAIPEDSRLSRREALLSVLSLIAAAPTISALPETLRAAVPDRAASMRILCFNTHLLPGIAQKVAGHRGQDDYRADALARQLGDYDLIGLCEVFENKRRHHLVETLQRMSDQAFQIVESPAPSGRHFVGGGLLLLSRFPIEDKPNLLTYRDASRFWRSGFKADGFAAKGVIHARLRLNDEPRVLVDCFLTHLESHSAEARQSQIRELAGFIAQHSSLERPLILFGDLNVTADHPVDQGGADSEYRLMMESFRYGKQPLVDVWPALEEGRGGTSDAIAGETSDRIDYILMSPALLSAKASIEPATVKVVPFLDKEVKEGSLSDHAGVECEARLNLR